MTDGFERTADERESARLERARERDQRSANEPEPEALYDDDPTVEGEAVPYETPSGTRRISHSQRAGTATAAPPRQRRPRQPPARGRRRHSWLGRLGGVLVLALAIAAIWFLYELFQPFHGGGHGRVTVTIPAKSSADEIGKLLEHDGVISSSFFFKLRTILAGDRADLRSGTYHLKLGMSYGDVLKILTTPPKPARVSELTLVEGKSRAQVAALLRSEHIRGNYVAATRHSRLLNPRAYGAPRSTPDLEGFLFPSTYQLRDPIRINALVADQLQTFRKEFGRVNLSYARRKHLTPYDVLIIASMVQTEAETEHDRPLIASVIYNRLRDGMPLQIDATTRYATGNYTTPLTESQLASSSPYNTRNRKGLPPTPIDSPGLASIEAAARPASTKYLYFVAKVCGNGEHVFESNYQQFLGDVARYQTARTRRGGRSPEKC
jgi:uncharacterized YceG family protein